jgi:hypothetical protein
VSYEDLLETLRGMQAGPFYDFSEGVSELPECGLKAQLAQSVMEIHEAIVRAKYLLQ